MGRSSISCALAFAHFSILLAASTMDLCAFVRRSFVCVRWHFSFGAVMDQQRTKRLLDFHAWAGVLSALFIYIVSLSGVFAVFKDELHQWEEVQVHFQMPTQSAPLMPLLSDYAETLQEEGRLASLDVHLPRKTRPYYEAVAYLVPEGETRAKKQTRRWHAKTGAPLEPREKGLTNWIVNFHRSLMLPRTAGRFIVGL